VLFSDICGSTSYFESMARWRGEDGARVSAVVGDAIRQHAESCGRSGIRSCAIFDARDDLVKAEPRRTIGVRRRRFGARGREDR